MNKMFIKNVNNQKGQVALFITMTIMFLLLFVGLFLTNELLKQIKSTSEKLHSIQAYYLADTGAEYVSYKLIRGGLDISGYSNGDEIFSDNLFDGTYKVILIGSDPNVSINATGNYKKTNRSIELKW